MPLFITRSGEKKLSLDDAHFVDIIHTNAATRGYWSAIGHVDFYVNGGYTQPGCTEAEYGSKFVEMETDRNSNILKVFLAVTTLEV